MLLSFVNGTGLFELRHLIFLVISIALIVILPIIAIKKKVKIETIYKILLIEGIISETLKVFTYIILNEDMLGGYLPKTDLPFHLCSIQIILIIILNFGKNENTKHLLQSFMIPTCLIGGIAALFLATSSSRSNWIIGIQYFSYHTAISAFAVYLLANKEIKFTAKDYVKTLIMLCIVLFVAIYLNSILYFPKYEFNELTGLYEAKEYLPINFMYVVNPPEEGLPFLNKNHGWLVYIVHYACLAFFLVTLLYIKPIIEYFKEKKSIKE